MKRLWVICLIIAALASVGFGYGVWSQNFNSLGPVSTGAYDVVFDSFTAPSPNLGATFSVYQVDSHTCDISLNNLYPTYTPTFNFVLKDTGSVPVKITDVKINGTSIVSGGSLNTTNIDLDGDGKTDITITVAGIVANSMIGANNGTLPGSLTVRTWAKISSDANDATANAGGSFTFEIDTVQNP
jgi:hypothetical protein